MAWFKKNLRFIIFISIFILLFVIGLILIVVGAANDNEYIKLAGILSLGTCIIYAAIGLCVFAYQRYNRSYEEID